MDKSFIKEIEEITKKIKDFVENQAPYKKVDIDVLQKQKNELVHQHWYALINQLIKAYERANIPNIDETIKNLSLSLSNQLSKTFSTIRQGTATNQLSKIRTNKSNTRIDDITGNAEILGDNNFFVNIANFNEIEGVKTSTIKLFDAITVQFTENGAKSRHIQLSLSEYMEICELTDRKEARKQVIKDLDTLGAISLKFTDHSTGKPITFARLNYFSFVGLKRNTISASFTEEFYKLCANYAVMCLPNEIFKLNSRINPNSHSLMRLVSVHKNMNYFKKNADIISVATLLKACPYIPNYEEVRKKDRAFTRRIIEPFERDLDACKNVFTWEYCHSNNEPLNKEEIDNFNYDTFKSLLIHINWHNYPDMSKRLEARNKRIKKEIKKRKKRG